MKVTLDLDRLLAEGSINQQEYDKLSTLAASATGSVAFNLLVGFGVMAVSGAALALAPAPATAIVIGLLILIAGLLLIRGGMEQWQLLANICILIGALMAGGGLIAEAKANLASILAVTVIYAVAAVYAKSALLAVLATLMLSASIGARTGYFHASYFLVIQEPTITILMFTILGIGLYLWSKRLTPDYERLAIASARTAVFLVNFGFWIGSLWGDRNANREVLIADSVFAVLWALALLATAIWAWKRNRRWVLNTVATFGGIHFYTQWFEHLGASPATVLFAGLLALGFAIAIRTLNVRMKQNAAVS